MSKIIGNPVGTTLPKPDWKQTDPTKGDYIKNKPEIIDASVGEFLAIKTIDEDGHIAEFESVEVDIEAALSSAKDYTDAEIAEWVGDTAVGVQIAAALESYYTKTEVDNMELITIEDIDTICGITFQELSDSEVTF